MKTAFKIGAGILAAILLAEGCICGYHICWNSIATREALSGAHHAPREVILDVRKHLRDKYDIRARAISSLSNYRLREFDLFVQHENYTGTYSLDMEADGHQFSVYVDADGTIRDNYQSEEIKERLREYLADYLPACDYTIDLSFGLLDEYIDTDTMTLQDFLDAHFTDITVYVIGMNPEDECFYAFRKLAKNTEGSFLLGSCRSEADREILIEAGAPSWESPTYAMQLESVWCCYADSREIRSVTYTLGQHGDLYYTVPKHSEIRITEQDADKYEEYPLLTPCFKINCSEAVTLFWPVPVSEAPEPEHYDSFRNIGDRAARYLGGYYVYTYQPRSYYKEHHYSVPKEYNTYGIYAKQSS